MKSGKNALIFFAFLLACLPSLQAQKSIRDSSISLTFLNITFGAYSPGGDMAERFGITNLMGGEVGYKFKNNFYGYTGAKFLFGRTVREWVASNVTYAVFDESGGFQIMGIGTDGRYYQIRYFERGFTVPLTAGKIIPVFNKANPNSGLYVELGTQFILHKIKIEPAGNNVPALDPEYRPGYDRLTTGLGLTQGFGYRHFGSNRLANFSIGLDISENFTRNRRTTNWDTGVSDTRQRMDLLVGFKAAWIFPIYRQAGKDFYFD